jgi:hypothetical protein
MTAVTDAVGSATVGAYRAPAGDAGLVPALAAALVVGGGLTLTGRLGATALLAGIAVTQAVFAWAWIDGAGLRGVRGTVVVAALAAAGADVAVSLFPHGRLGALLIVLGLAAPVLFASQLLRGAARTQVTGALSVAAVAVLGCVGVAALAQVRHEFAATGDGATAAVAAAAVPAAALVVGYLVDMVVPTPRFDRRVARGVPALLASVAVGVAVGYLLLRHVAGFGAAPGVFVGAALGVLAGLLAVATAFVQYTTGGSQFRERRRRAERAVSAAVLPMCVLAPVSFLLLLAIRS